MDSMLCGGALSVEIILFIIEKEVYMQNGFFFKLVCEWAVLILFPVSIITEVIDSLFNICDDDILLICTILIYCFVLGVLLSWLTWWLLYERKRKRLNQDAI